MQFIIKSLPNSVIWKGTKFDPKDNERHIIAIDQVKSAFKEYSQKFKDCIVEVEWQDDQGLCSLEIDTDNF